MVRSLAAALVCALLFFFGREARAERELIVPFDEAGHCVLDNLAGLRVDGESGASYEGAIGVASRTTKEDSFTPGGPSSEATQTSLWFAPSADVFVAEHFSVGARIEIAHAWGAVEGGGQRVELPGATSMTFLPRIGFHIPINDRIGIWPRIGFGYTNVESASFASTGSAVQTETFHAMLLDVNLSVVYRFGETFFLRAGPEVGLTIGGRREVESNGQSVGAGKSMLQLSGTLAFGMNFEL